MSRESEEYANPELVDGSETTLHSHSGGGGSSPKVFQAVKTGTESLSSSMTTVDFEDVQIIDTSNFSESGGEVTILVAGRYEIDVMVNGYGGSSRTEIQLQLQINGSPVLYSYNYTSRNTTERRGGVWINGYIKQLSINDVVRVQAARVGTTPSFIANGCHFKIRSV